MLRSLFALIGLSLTLVGMSAQAQQDAPGRLGVGYSNLGLGIYYSTPSAAQWETQISYLNGTPKFATFSVGNAAYSSTNKFNGFGLFGNYYPIYGSGFRFTLGAYFAQPTTTFTLAPNSGVNSVDIAGASVTTNGATSITGEVKMNDRSFAPYAGVGYTAVVGNDSAFRVNLDVGALFLNPSVSINCSGCTQADVMRAQEAILGKTKKVNPVYSIAVDYSF